MASARSKRTYIIGWDCCGSLPLRNGRGITAGLNRHFKTNHTLTQVSLSVLSPQGSRDPRSRFIFMSFFDPLTLK